MNCQEQQMTQQMCDAMPQGMTVNYHQAMENMTLEVTVSEFNGATYRWDAEVGAWYATQVTNLDAVMRAYAERVYRGMDVYVQAQVERVYA